MRSIHDTLTSTHRIAGQAQGEIALALSSKRGVSRAKLAEWSHWYAQAADALAELASSLPVRSDTE